VYARNIIDVTEQTLPAHGEFQFAKGEEVIALDCADAAISNQYQLHMQQRHATLAQWFAQADIDYQTYRADDDLFALK